MALPPLSGPPRHPRGRAHFAIVSHRLLGIVTRNHATAIGHGTDMGWSTLGWFQHVRSHARTSSGVTVPSAPSRTSLVYISYRRSEARLILNFFIDLSPDSCNSEQIMILYTHCSLPPDTRSRSHASSPILSASAKATLPPLLKSRPVQER